ncbi:hypothetical protein [Pseudomonas sp. DSP3-2-2]|uniref:hypothetical protein n=1 Tax=unclassified Pseudomonas TaxID=196821 RepID=UPI003CF7E502
MPFPADFSIADAYAFIVGTPFADIEYYPISPQAYGWLFGVNIARSRAARYSGLLIR